MSEVFSAPTVVNDGAQIIAVEADLGDQDKLMKILDEGKGMFPEKIY